MNNGIDFELFVHKMSPPLTNYCAAITGGADAEDAAQEAFLRLWRNLHRIRDESAARAFLYRSAYRICIDMLRRRKNFREPERQHKADNSLSDRTEAALRMLSPLDRAVIYSRVVEDAEYSEIASSHGKSEAWARKRYSLARKKLEQLLTAPESNFQINKEELI